MTLYLHIGYVKTGSTAIQASLANNLQYLNDHSYSLPADQSRMAQIKMGRTLPGNGDALVNAMKSNNSVNKIYKLISSDIATQPKSRNIIYSSELLFFQLISEDNFLGLAEAAKRVGIADICILLFVRNPLEHALSWYSQCIKQGASSENINDFLVHYRFPIMANRLIANCNNTANVSLRVHNYSRCKSDIIDISWDFLKIRKPSDFQTKDSVCDVLINRSLTLAEAELCRQLTAHGCSPTIVGNAFTYALPNIKPSYFKPSTASVKHLYKINQKPLVALNAYLNENEKLPISPCHNEVLGEQTEIPTEAEYAFSSAQLGIIASEMARLYRKANS